MSDDTPSARRTRAATREIQAEGQQEEDQSWLLVYLDVITLLLIVFVVLLAILGDKSEQEGTGQGAGVLDGSPAILEGRDGVLEGEPQLDERPVELPEALRERGIEAVGEEETLTFRLDDAVLFNTGEAELRGSGEEALDELVPILQRTGARLSVEGHTDDRPIATERFPSNWELSAARASSVLRYLNEQGIDKQRMRAIGYGEIRPIADNGTAEGRAENRRVEITLHLGLEASPENLPDELPVVE